MTSSGPDPARDAAVARLLGCTRAAGPRAILGLGDGPIDSDTLEAALATRRRMVQSNASTRGLAEAAISELEAAAAALRPGATAGRGRSAPVPPIRPTRPSVTAPPPSGPIAGRPKTPVRPTPRITAAHLTPFDRLVLSILVSGGGWNGRTRVLVAGLAHKAGLDAATLRRVVSGLASFMREQGVAGTFGEVARAEHRPAPPPPAPGRLESTVLRVAEGVGREFRGDTRSSFYRLVTLFGLVAVFFGIVLVTALTAPSPVVRDTNIRRQEAEERRTRRLEEEAAATDPTHTVVPSTRPGVVRPVAFARPPMLRGDARPETVVLELGRVPSALDDLSQLASRLELDTDELGEGRRARWADAVSLFARTWPGMPADERSRVADAILDVLRFADDPEIADRLLAPLDVDPTAPIRNEFDPWTRAFQSGVLGRIVVDETLPESVREIARRWVSERLPGSDGRHAAGGPFAELGGRTLDVMGAMLVEQAGVMGMELFADSWERWFEAIEAIRRPDARQRALVAALGRVLAVNRGLGNDGPSTDLLGRLVREIDWTAAGPDPESLRDAFRAWMRDSSIDAQALWVLGSVLDGPAGIGWFRPEFVLDPVATPGIRLRVLADVIDAWPEGRTPVAKGELLPVDPDLLALIDRLAAEVAATIRDARTNRELLESLLAAERLALGTTLLSVDRIREAEVVIGQVMAQVDSQDSGIDMPDELSPVVRGNDGEFAQSLKEAGRDAEARAAILDALLADALSGDLGPRDAEALVQEAWRGSPAAVRDVARSVILDGFAGGPNVAVEMLGTVDRAARSEDTAEFIEQYANVTLPSRRDDDWDAAVRRALARHAVALLDTQAVGIDRIADAVGETVLARATARDAGLGSPLMHEDPAASAAAAADSARRVATGLFLAPGGDRSLEDIDRRRLSRRRLAADEVRRLVAEHVAELEYLEFILEARVPIRRDQFRRLLEDAADERAASDSGLRQAAATALRLAELERLRMIDRDTDPLGAAG